ncbi:putative toxin-antitoxin system toxin component, PIN family [Bacteroides zhangwenhongii]|uniref:putative toxin-antitoxin system toxin component, PIN family n=1 Tax=Bacteroides zhangwenhongii TaxID=2650157 RepID=UPI003AABCFE6
MKIIIDTNLWISFMLGRKLTTMRSLLTYPTLEIYVCRELLDEFYDVSSREKIQKYIHPEDLDDTLKLIHLYGKYVVIRTQSKSEIRDKKDFYLLSLADTIKANYIVTGDKDLLVLEKHNHTKIVTITEFMKLL